MDNKHLSFFTSNLHSGSRPKGGVRGINSGTVSIGGEHLNDRSGFDFSNIKYVTKEFAESMSKGKVKINDILIVKDGATTGKVSFIDSSFPYKDATINEHVFILRVNEKILPKFLFWYLWSQNGQNQIKSNFQGSAQGGINKSFVDGVSVPFFPLEHQENIILQLDKQIPLIWFNIDRLKKTKKLISKFRQAVLFAAVTGKLTEDWREKNSIIEPAIKTIENIQRSHKDGKLLPIKNLSNQEEIPNWTTCQLKNLFSVQTGGTPYRKNELYYQDGTIHWVKTGEVKNYDIYSTEEKITQLALDETNVKIFPINTILIAMYGEGKTRGQVGRLKIEAATNQACAALVNPNLPYYFNEYVFYFCLSQYLYLRQVASGGNQPNLNLQKIKDWEISIPPKEEMVEIVKRIKASLDVADQVEKQISSAEKKIEKLIQSILAKTFQTPD